MGDDADVRKLVDFIFLGQFSNPAEETVENPSVPTFLKTLDFSQKMLHVLSVKKLVICARWNEILNTCLAKILSSHEKYITFLMEACLKEFLLKRNVFECFINVCTLLIYVSRETFTETAINFQDLNPDIFIVFYRSKMRELFQRNCGFLRFEAYILSHEYLAFEFKEIAPLLYSTTALSNPTEKNLVKRFKKVSRGEFYSLNASDFKVTAMSATSISLAQEVLSTTSVELPILPSYADLVTKLVEFRRNEKLEILKEHRSEVVAKCEAFGKVLQGFEGHLKKVVTKSKSLEKVSKECSVSNFCSNTNHPDKKIAKTASEYRIEAAAKCEAFEEGLQESSSANSCSETIRDHNKIAKIVPEHSIEAAMKCESFEEVLQESSSTNSCSETNHDNKQQETVAQYESIIQAVIRHNRSKKSNLVNSNNPIQKEVDGVLGHLKDTIKSLIHVLAEYDEE